MFGRALVFVASSAATASDGEAKDAAFGMSLKETQRELLRRGRSRRGVGKRRAARGVARNLAEFCLLTGRSKEEYLLLTRLEREEFIDAAKDARAEPGASR
jgi:hypothetical protein